MKKITYDPSVDAAYIYFQLPETLDETVSKTHCCDPEEVGVGLILILIKMVKFSEWN